MLIAGLCACGSDDIVGDSYATIYGIKMDVEYRDSTLSAEDGVYNLYTGTDYSLKVSLIQGGGSTPAGFYGEDLTFACSESVTVTWEGEGVGTYNVYVLSCGTPLQNEVITAYLDSHSCSITVNFTLHESN